MPRNEGGSLLDDLSLELDAGRPAARTRPAMAERNAGAAGAEPFTGAAGSRDTKQKLDDLLQNYPDFDQMFAVQKRMVERDRKRKEEEAAREARRREVQQEAEEEAEEDERSGQLIEGMEALKEQWGLLSSLEEYRESEAVLQPLPPPEASSAADLDLDADYLGAMHAAGAALGLADGLPELAASKEERQELFWSGLRSGYVRNVALQRGTASQPLVQALLDSMTQCSDAETAGAAFVTLMALMGDDDTAGSGASGMQAERQKEGAAALAPGVGSLLLDAQYGLPAAAPAGSPALPACQLACVPSDEQLVQALRLNGYNPGAAGSSAGAAGSSGSGSRRQQQQQQGAAPPLGQQQQQQAEREEEAALLVRLQAIKLILRTTAAVCRYCRKHPLAAGQALSREGVSELLLAALHMGLDPCANQLQEDLDAAVLELLGALEESDWLRKLPQLADRVAEMGPSHKARLKLLRKLPTAHPRGLALQQFASAVLLERLLPPGKHGLATKQSAVNRRDPAALDPTAVISAQPWFEDGKGLATQATSGSAVAPRGGYHITLLEPLLKLCHLLLWPHMLKHAMDEPSCLGTDFLRRWHAFLLALVKNVKSPQPEDANVRALASTLDLEYKMLAESGGMQELDAHLHHNQ